MCASCGVDPRFDNSNFTEPAEDEKSLRNMNPIVTAVHDSVLLKLEKLESRYPVSG